VITRILWALWAVLPVIGFAWHFGPGQVELRRDEAARALVEARAAEQVAKDAQRVAHEAQLERLAADKVAFLADPEDQATRLAEAARRKEDEAYAVAADKWKRTADAYQVVEELLGERKEGLVVRWAKARALVRAGEIWNGIDEFRSIVAVAEYPESSDPRLALAAREELAVANYYGARLLREEGKEDDARRMIAVLDSRKLSLNERQEQMLEKECLMLGVPRLKRK